MARQIRDHSHSIVHTHDPSAASTDKGSLGHCSNCYGVLKEVVGDVHVHSPYRARNRREWATVKIGGKRWTNDY